MDDLISRQAAIDALGDMPMSWADTDAEIQAQEDWQQHLEALLNLPTAEKKGKWERHYSRPNVYADLFWHCSECGYKNDENYAPVFHHFCPNCGARMEN